MFQHKFGMSEQEEIGLLVIAFIFIDLCLSELSISHVLSARRAIDGVDQTLTSFLSVSAVLNQYLRGTNWLYSNASALLVISFTVIGRKCVEVSGAILDLASY